MKILKRLIIFLGIIFLAIVILLFAIFLVIKHIKAPQLVEREIEKELGINVSVKKLEFSPFLTQIRLEGITVHNPAGFDEKELAYIDSINLVWDPLQLFIYKKPNIYLVAFDLKRLNIIKNAQGKVNLKELIPIKDTSASSTDQTPFSFDVLVLSVQDVNYTEYAAGVKKTHKYPIGIKDQAFVNLKDENQLIKLIIYKAVQNTDIAKLINLTITPIVSNVSDTLNAAWGTAKAGGRGALEIATLPFKLIFGK